MKNWSKIMFLHTVVLFATMALAQPVTADFFEIQNKISLNDTITWVSFSDVIALDFKNQKIFWDVNFLRESFKDADGTIRFEILLNRRIGMDFPSQALPLITLKGILKDESEVQLELTYTGKEQ